MLARACCNGQTLPGDPASLTRSSSPGLLDGPELRAAFAAASQHLRELAPSIDAINVYPVPDGDTGSNMSATLRAAVEQTALLEGVPDVAAVLQTLSRGALYGARGNSGVILSQALRGFARGADAPRGFDASALAAGLREASIAAYAAMTDPHEGTMLTVLRCAAEAAASHASTLQGAGATAPCTSTLAEAIRAAQDAEAATIDQLPALREAGVPDAGGEGVCVILRGLFAAITGAAPPAPVMPSLTIASLAAFDHHDALGFCTEFVIEPTAEDGLPVERIRSLASAGANSSVLVVGDEQAMHVHVHTDQPDALLDGVRLFGRVSRVKVENMDAQNRRYQETGSGAGRRLAVVALSRGDGFDEVFRGLGMEVSDLGEVVKPPAGEIATAADVLRIPDVIVLANHKNVVLAARQAATLTRCSLHVVPTETLPQGVAAALAFDPDATVSENLKAMNAAATAIKTVEVTTAAADRTIAGIHVRKGDAIALVDARLAATGPSLRDALLAGLREAGAASAALVTVYGGSATTGDELERVSSMVSAAFPGVEIETIVGGQPLYPLIASVES